MVNYYKHVDNLHGDAASYNHGYTILELHHILEKFGLIQVKW